MSVGGACSNHRARVSVCACVCDRLTTQACVCFQLCVCVEQKIASHSHKRTCTACDQDFNFVSLPAPFSSSMHSEVEVAPSIPTCGALVERLSGFTTSHGHRIHVVCLIRIRPFPTRQAEVLADGFRSLVFAIPEVMATYRVVLPII